MRTETGRELDEDRMQGLDSRRHAREQKVEDAQLKETDPRETDATGKRMQQVVQLSLQARYHLSTRARNTRRIPD